MIITHIIRTDDNVLLCNSSKDYVTLSYAGWAQFMQKRGTLSLPFSIAVEPTNVVDFANRHDQGVTITDAANI